MPVNGPQWSVLLAACQYYQGGFVRTWYICVLCDITHRHGLNSEWDLAGVNNEPTRVVN